MLKKILAHLSVALVLLFGQSGYADSRLFFNVASSGVADNVSINLCLNGKVPVSCQQYNVSGLTLSISTAIPGHLYPVAGIKINTPGYTLANLGVDCNAFSNGYCLFKTSKTSSKLLTILKGGAQQYTVNASGDSHVTATPSTQRVNFNATGVVTLNVASGYAANIASNTCGGGLSGNHFTTGPITGPCSVSFSSTTVVLSAAGYINTTNDRLPLIAISTDSGTTWAAKSVRGLPAGIFFSTSCTGSGSSAICTAVGADYTGNEPPLLAISADGGATWATNSGIGFLSSGVLMRQAARVAVRVRFVPR